jgi:hypothetical protein
MHKRTDIPYLVQEIKNGFLASYKITLLHL